MPLFPPQAFRNTVNTHRRGSRAEQPLPSNVLPGTLYFVVEEGRIEQSNGLNWVSYIDSKVSNLVNYSFSVNQQSPPSTNQVRFNAGFPYTAVTKLYFDDITADGQDIHVGLIRVPPGSLIYVQDKNDASQYGTFQTLNFPVDHQTWVEFNVIHFAHGNSIGGGQLVLIQSTNGPTPVTQLELNLPLSLNLLGGEINDFDNPVLSQTQVLRFAGDINNPSHLTGIVPTLGRLIIIANTGVVDIFIDLESLSSIPSARFAFSATIPSGESIMCWYDTVSDRWRRLNG